MSPDDSALRPARPHTAMTEDGRRVREVLTYSRRGSGMSAKQKQTWERHSGNWWIPDSAADGMGFDPARWFGRPAPLIVEIGSGIGEATAALAAARPSYNVLAFEVWRPGLAETFLRLEQLGVTNVRLASIDAVWSVEHLLPAQSINELWTFFPDPWPKRRHHRRRLVNPSFAHVAASRMAPGALWRLATDWPDYARQMEEVLSGEMLLEDVHGGPVTRWPERPVTRFERRGIRAGHRVTDLAFRRRSARFDMPAPSLTR